MVSDQSITEHLNDADISTEPMLSVKTKTPNPSVMQSKPSTGVLNLKNGVFLQNTAIFSRIRIIALFLNAIFGRNFLQKIAENRDNNFEQ
jgi:hypothetical protein